MAVGISTACFYPERTEKSVEYLCENGVDRLEIFFNTASEMSGEVLSRIKSAVLKNSVKVVSVHPFTSAFEPFMLFSDYERRFEDGLEFYKRYFDVCNALGSKILVLHGDRADRTNFDERYFERYLGLFRAAKQSGVTLAQENVSYCRSSDTEFLKNMRHCLKSECAFVLDLKQARRANRDYRDYICAMGDSLVHLHANDFDLENDCLLAGKGRENFYEVYANLRSAGFKGDSIIEVYRSNYKEYSELIDSLKFLKNIESKKDFTE